MSADIRTNINGTNAKLLIDKPIYSTLPTDGQVLVFKDDYWVWSDDVITVGTDQTISAEVTFDGTTRIGANGTPINRWNTFVGPNSSELVLGTFEGHVAHATAFPSVPTLMANTVNTVNAANADRKITMIRNPNTVDGFDYVWTNLNTGGESSMHVNSLAIA